jgi:hypothetical protein
MRSLVIGLSFALLVPAVAAANETQPAQQEQPQGKPKKERLICKRQDVTASRTASAQRCLTAEQWSAEARGDISFDGEIGNRGRSR